MQKDHINGEFESMRFDHLRPDFYKAFEEFGKMGYSTDDFINHFSCFIGHLTLSRFLAFYELYKKVLNVAGHIAEVGTYKGASLLYFAKLVRLFENNSLTQVHAFDWFKGSEPGKMETKIVKGGYAEPYERVKKLVEIQKLQDIVRIHVVDVRTDLKKFFQKNKYMQFKIVFLDAGTYDNVRACIPEFWPRITKGGILILDQYNHELSPGETIAAKELLPDVEIKTLSNFWMPTAYVEK